MYIYYTTLDKNFKTENWFGQTFRLLSCLNFPISSLPFCTSTHHIPPQYSCPPCLPPPSPWCPSCHLHQHEVQAGLIHSSPHAFSLPVKAGRMAAWRLGFGLGLVILYCIILDSIKGWLKKLTFSKSLYLIKNHSSKELYDKDYTIGYYSGFYSSLRDTI